MGTRKQIYVPDESIWEDIKARAKLFNRSVSNYLLWLHEVQSKVVPFPDEPVIREDRDLTEEERLEGGSVIVRTVEEVRELYPDQPGYDEHPEEVTAIDDIVTTEVEIPESKSVLKRKAIQKPNESVIVNIEEPKVDTFVPGYSKEHQTRKSKK